MNISVIIFFRSRRDVVSKCAAKRPVNDAVDQLLLSSSVQQTCPNPNNRNEPIKSPNIESSTQSNVNIGRSLFDELLRSGKVKRKSASGEDDQCKSSEKSSDQRYNELIGAFNVILEEISRQKKGNKVSVDISSVLNQMAPQTKAIVRKRPLHQIYSKKGESRSHSRDKVLDQSQMKLLRSIEKLESQLTKFIDKLRQNDDCESNDENDEFSTYDEEEFEPGDFDYIDVEPNPKVLNDIIRRSKRSVKNRSESTTKTAIMVTEL